MKGVNWLLSLTALYVVILAAITILNLTGADRFWLGALNLYLPQFMWALPGLFLLFLFLKLRPAWCWLPLLCVLWVLGPIMGFKYPLHAAHSATGSRTIKVMTWNLKYGSYRIEPLIEQIVRSAPDLVFFQDAGGSMSGPLREYFRDWQVRYQGQYVIASKFPLSDAQEYDLPSSGRKEESFLHCRMYIGGTAVSLYNVHLKTPRWSLKAFGTARKRPWYLPEAIARFDHNVKIRYLQALAVQGHLIEEQGPVILAGDLNSPDASRACATLRECGLYDAFAESGRGYGFTYGQLLLKHRLPSLQLSWMRIDHIMVTPDFVTERCWTGTGKASDHRPVIAEITLSLR